MGFENSKFSYQNIEGVIIHSFDNYISIIFEKEESLRGKKIINAYLYRANASLVSVNGIKLTNINEIPIYYINNVIIKVELYPSSDITSTRASKWGK